MTFRTILTSALVALSVVIGGASAFAASRDTGGEFDGYPPWAQRAFAPNDGG